MEKDPESLPVQDEMEDHNVNRRKCSIWFKVACLDSIILAYGLSSSVMHLAGYDEASALDSKEDGVKDDSPFGNMLFPAFFIAVPLIWANLFLVSDEELKSDVKQVLKIIWFCKMSSLLFIVGSFVEVIFGFSDLDSNIWVHFISLNGTLLAAFFYGMWLERVFKWKTENEKETSEEEAQKSELFVSEKTKVV